jgi:hypothetical protein
MSKQKQDHGKRGNRSSASDRRVATVQLVRADEEAGLLQSVLSLPSSKADNQQVYLVLTIVYDEQGSNLAHWTIEMQSASSVEQLDKLDLLLKNDEVTLDSVDIAMLKMVAAKFNRVFCSNLFITIPPEWRDDQSEGKEVKDVR